MSISIFISGFISKSTSFLNFLSDDFLELELELEELLELECESLLLIFNSGLDSNLVSISIFSVFVSVISVSTFISNLDSFLCSISTSNLTSDFISKSTSFFNFLSDDFLELELELEELLELECESLLFIFISGLDSNLVSISIFSVF